MQRQRGGTCAAVTNGRRDIRYKPSTHEKPPHSLEAAAGNDLLVKRKQVQFGAIQDGVWEGVAVEPLALVRNVDNNSCIRCFATGTIQYKSAVRERRGCGDCPCTRVDSQIRKQTQHFTPGEVGTQVVQSLASGFQFMCLQHTKPISKQNVPCVRRGRRTRRPKTRTRSSGSAAAARSIAAACCWSAAARGLPRDKI